MKDVRYKLKSDNPEIFQWFKDEYYPDVEGDIDSQNCVIGDSRHTTKLIIELAERGWKLHLDYQIIKMSWEMQYVEREVKEGEYL